MTIPPDVLSAIKKRAAIEWPSDYSMQLHMVDSQSTAYLEMARIENSVDTTNEVTETVLKKAKDDWPEDYEMQVHVFQQQMDAAIAFFDYTSDVLPPETLEEIKVAAFAEWQGDYEMMLHTLTEQVSSWITLNG